MASFDLSGEIVAYTGAVLIAGDDMTPLRDAVLNVQGGRILAIGAPLPGARVIDLGDNLISPLFVNSHTHLGDSGAKELGMGLPLEAAVVPPDGLKHRYLAGIDEATLIRTMRDAMLDMLHGGTVAFADFREGGLAGVRALRRAAAGLPIRAVILGRMAEGATAVEMEHEADALLAEADGLGVRDVESYPANLMQTLRDRYPDKIFAVHAAEGYAAQQASLRTTGRTQIARALDWNPDLLIHLVHATPDDLAQAAARGVIGGELPPLERRAGRRLRGSRRVAAGGPRVRPRHG